MEYCIPGEPFSKVSESAVASALGIPLPAPSNSMQNQIKIFTPHLILLSYHFGVYLKESKSCHRDICISAFTIEQVTIVKIWN